MNAQWFFETWSPHDGIAFASRRRATEANREAVVALLPPYWRPVQVALPTALRAERGPFQVGFFDDQGTAIGFDTLQDLINVVRQAYIAAGSGRPPEGEGPGARLPDLPPPPSLGKEVSAWNEALEALFTKDRTSEGASIFADKLVHNLGTQLGDLFRSFGERIFRRMAADARTRSDDVLVWCDVLGRMGLGDHAVHARQLVQDDKWNQSFWWTGVDLRGEFAGGLLFRTPHPIDPTTLGDTLAKEMADRSRLEGATFAAFAALLFAAAALHVAATGRVQSSVPDAWLQEVQRNAATWIFWNAPMVPWNGAAGEALAKWSPT